MTEPNQETIANEVNADRKTVQKSAKTVVRLLQGLGVGLIMYFTIPMLLFVLFDAAARRMSYMNIMCPDEVQFYIDRQNREIFISQVNAKNETIEVISQSDDNISIKVKSPDDIVHEKVIDFRIDESGEVLAATAPTATKAVTLKVTQANLDCLPSNDYDEAAILILLSFVGGATGSVISILSRVSQYNIDNYDDTNLPFYIGLFKPIIGGTFGVFVFTILASGLIQISNPLSANDNNLDSDLIIEKWLFFIGISFVGGFSERLAQDIISVTENRFGGDADAEENA